MEVHSFLDQSLVDSTQNTAHSRPRHWRRPPTEMGRNWCWLYVVEAVKTNDTRREREMKLWRAAADWGSDISFLSDKDSTENRFASFRSCQKRKPDK